MAEIHRAFPRLEAFAHDPEFVQTGLRVHKLARERLPTAMHPSSFHGGGTRADTLNLLSEMETVFSGPMRTSGTKTSASSVVMRDRHHALRRRSGDATAVDLTFQAAGDLFRRLVKQAVEQA